MKPLIRLLLVLVLGAAFPLSAVAEDPPQGAEATPTVTNTPRVGGGTMIGAFFDAKEGLAARVAKNAPGLNAAEEQSDPFSFWLSAYNGSGGGPLSKTFGVEWLSKLHQPAMKMLIGLIMIVIMGLNAIQISNKGAAGEASGSEVRAAIAKALAVPVIFAGLPLLYATAQSIQEIGFYAFVGGQKKEPVILSGIDNSIAPQVARFEGVMAASTAMAGIADYEDGKDEKLKAFARKIDEAIKAVQKAVGNSAGLQLIGDVDALPHDQLVSKTKQAFLALIPKLAMRVPGGKGTPGYDLYAVLKPQDDDVATKVNALGSGVAETATKQQLIGGYKVGVQQATHDWIFTTLIEPIFKDSADASKGSTGWWQRLKESYLDPAVGAIRNAMNTATQAIMQGISNFLMWLARLFVFEVMLPMLVYASAFAMEVEMFFIGLTIPLLTSTKLEGIFYGQTKALFITSLWLPLYALGIYLCDQSLATLLLNDMNVMSQGAAAIGATGASVTAAAQITGQGAASLFGITHIAAASIAASLVYLVFSVIWAFFSYKSAKGLANGEGVAGKLLSAGFASVGSVAMAGLAAAGVGAAAGGSAIAARAGGSKLLGAAGKSLQGVGNFARSAVGMQDLTAAQTIRASAGGLAKTAVSGGTTSFIDHASSMGNSYRAENKEKKRETQETAAREEARSNVQREIAMRADITAALQTVGNLMTQQTVRAIDQGVAIAGADVGSPNPPATPPVDAAAQTPAPPRPVTPQREPVMAALPSKAEPAIDPNLS